KIEEELRNALSEAFGPISFNTSADCGAVTLLLYYFASARLERPIEGDPARRIAQAMVTTWEDRVAIVLESAFGEREGRRLFQRYIRFETRSGRYRERSAPEGGGGEGRALGSCEPRLEVSVLSRSAEAAALKLYSVKALGLTSTLRTLQNLGLSVTDELQVPLVLPERRKGVLYRFGIECAPERIAALHAGAERFSEALRAVDEGSATDDPLNGLVLQVGLAWGGAEVLPPLRNHLLQIRPHYNVETVNGVLLRNSQVAAALVRSFAARFNPELPGDRAAVMQEADAGVRTALEAVKSLAEDEVLRGFDNLVRCSLRTNFYQRPQRPVVSIKVDSRRVE